MAFGDYAPFLELSCAVNLLLAAWGATWQRLGDWVDKLRAKSRDRASTEGARVGRAAGMDYDNSALDKWHERIGRVRRWIRGFARWFAAGMTIAIMTALFFFDPDAEVSALGLWLIALSPLAQPMLMATMVIVDALCFRLFVAIPAWSFTRKALRAIRSTPGAAETASTPPSATELAGGNLPPVPPGYRFEDGFVFGPGDEVIAVIVGEEGDSTLWVLPVAAELMAIGRVRFAAGTSRERAFHALAVHHHAANAN